MWLNFRHEATVIFAAGHERECVGGESSETSLWTHSISQNSVIKYTNVNKGLLNIYHQFVGYNNFLHKTCGSLWNSRTFISESSSKK